MFQTRIRSFHPALAGTVVLLGISFILLVVFTVFKAPTLGYDEAFRAFQGAQLRSDLLLGDLSAFLKHTDEQRFWPFLYSWYLCFFYLVAEPSVLVTRIASLLLFLVCGWMVFLSARQSDERQSPWCGLLALWIFLTMPEVVRHSAIPMLEIAAMLLALASLILFNRFLENPKQETAVGIGILLALQVFLKYNYAFYTFAALALILLISFFEKRPGARCRQLFITAAVTLLLCLAWFLPSFKAKIGEVIRFGVSVRYTDEPFWSFSYLGYYLVQVFSKYSLSNWMGLLFLIGFPFAMWRWSNYRLRSFVIYGLVAFILSTIHPQKSPRFGLPFAIILPITTSYLIFALGKILQTKFNLCFLSNG